MAYLYTPQKISELANKWFDYYKDNNTAGYLTSKFIAGFQWDPKTKKYRRFDGKEIMTVNLTIKHYYRLQSDYANLEFELGVKNKTRKNTPEIKNAETLYKNILFCDENRSIYADTWSKYGSFGYTAFRVVEDYEALESTQLIPKIKHIMDPENAFFDTSARGTWKEDGEFCGEIKSVPLSKLRKHYSLSKLGRYYNSRNEDETYINVYDFFYKEDVKTTLYKLRSGEVKKEDSMTEYDNVNILDSFQKFVTRIYACRCTDEEFLTKPTLYYSDDLPIIFVGHPFLTKDGDKGGTFKEIVVPYMYSMVDVQQLLNNAVSQVATQTTRKMERTILLHKGDMTSQDVMEWKDINRTPGVYFLPTPEPNAPQNAQPTIIEPPVLDTTLIQLIQMSKVLLDEVAGINLSQQGSSQDGAQSGVALEKRIMQGDIVQKKLLHVFIRALNRVGKVFMDMMANLITDKYEMLINNELITLNDGNKNTSLAELKKNYDFTIEAAPSTSLEKLRTAETMMSLLKVTPQIAPAVIDLVARNLEINDSVEIEHRLNAFVDPTIKALGEGKITEEQYAAMMQQRQQEGPQDPTSQAIQAQAQSDHEANMIRAEEVKQRYATDQTKLALEQSKILVNKDLQEKKLAIQALQNQNKSLTSMRKNFKIGGK